ncbi:efflux RND transporter permease subunit [Desulfohalobiaceae bacterium Ax17]|uniref:efflux RND transporter permease subunit n=1 Tax=Desulfovulcanus ferrireducens TaxID=2831190 RepID=UPI00207BB6E8|nr:efflux RND transporter permease subunit [Desulfovulcanus ferrireducens]MBT8763216.1 efflux RND transporter permease subunit [Desulfovulcanus ferrireducens]
MKHKNFAEFVLSRSHLVASLVLITAVLGLIGFKYMPLNLFPDANYPSVVVLISQPGAAAGDMEDKVTRPLEKVLASISLVRKVRSVSQDEMVAVAVEFEYEKGLDAAATDVANAIKRIEASLPPDILPPQIFKVSDATVPVFTLALSPKPGTHLDLSKVRQLADNELREDFLRIPEVGDVEVFGGYSPELLVEIDARRLHAHGLSLEQVIMAIRSQNINLPAGLILQDHQQFRLKTSGEKLTRAEIEEIVIASSAQGEISLKDVARVRTHYRERQSLFRGNGHPAIGVNLLRSETGHVTTTIAAVEKALPEIEAKYPEIAFEIADTQKELIGTSIDNMVDALRDSVIMTVGVIFLVLASLRLSLLSAISIPLACCMAFAGMYLLGYELNIVTLTAIILSVGLLVDDSIVVIENIERHATTLGKPIRQAVVDGLNEIVLADWAGTFTTVIVLVPIMFIGGYVEKILRPLTTVLSLTLAASFLVSVTIIPLLAPYVVGRSSKRNPLERLATLVDRYTIEPMKDFFAKLVHVGLRHRAVFLLGGVILLILSIRQLPLAGRDLMPPMDTGIIKINFEAESDASLSATESIAKRLEAILMEMPEVQLISVAVGSEPGVVSFGTGRIPQQGQITAHFVDRFHRKETIWELEEKVRLKAATIPGLKSIDVYDFGATPLSSIAAPVDVMLSGPDPKILDSLADEVVRRLRKVRGLTTVTRSWTGDRTEVVLKVDEAQAIRYGLDPVEISRQIATAVNGGPASILRVPGEDGYQIRIRYAPHRRDSLMDIKSIQITTKTGPIPLSQIATLARTKTRTKFTRQNLEPTVNIYGYRSEAAISHIQAQVSKTLQGLPLPPGYRLSQEGEIKKMGESGQRLAKALSVAVILLFFSLATAFRSWTNPIVIMGAIPLALIGAAWGLLLTGRHMCMPASMGMILLAGIVVNNSILLIDFIEKARAKGMALLEAIEQSVRMRTRPILMTVACTVVGMLPVALEQALGLERLSPLAVVAIGGLVSSTILTLVYIPILYSLLDGLREKVLRKFHLIRGTHSSHGND